jgi:hypothetical protein
MDADESDSTLEMYVGFIGYREQSHRYQYFKASRGGEAVPTAARVLTAFLGGYLVVMMVDSKREIG